MAQVDSDIGTARDYTTLTAWEADVYNTATSADDARAFMFDDGTYSTGSDINISDDTPDTVTIVAEPGHECLGIADGGVRLQATGNAILLNFQLTMTSATVEDIELDTNDNGPRHICRFAGNNASTEMYIRRLLCHGLVRSSNQSEGINGGTSRGAFIANCIVYKVHQTGSAAAPCHGINLDYARTWSATAHNTVYNIQQTHASSTSEAIGITLEDSASAHGCESNLVCTVTSAGSGTARCFDDDTGFSSLARSHNLSTDTSAPGASSVTSITLSDQFVSTTAGSEDLHLIETSDAIDVNQDSTSIGNDIQTDINLIDRTAMPAASSWIAGAHQYKISSTVGATARDYTTLIAWEAANYGTVSSDDWGHATMYDDADFNHANVLINDTAVAKLTMTVDSASRHDGTANSGARLLCSSSNTIVFQVSVANTTLEWFEVDGNGGTNDNNILFADTGNFSPKTVNNCIFHNLLRTADANGVIFGDGTTDEEDIFIRNIIYDIDSDAANGNSTGLQVDGASGRDRTYCNNTIYGVVATGTGSALCVGSAVTIHSAIILKNNYAGGATGGTTNEDWDSAYTWTDAAEDSNASSDTTASGTNAVTSAAGADQFVSVSAGTEDFHLATGGGTDLKDAGVDLGTTPTGVNIDIDGFDMDATTTYDPWDIGVHELQEAVGGAADFPFRIYYSGASTL